MTIFFNLKPGYAIGDATTFVENAAKEILPPDVRGGLQGEALDVPRDGVEPDDPDGAGRFRDVRHSGHPVRKLSAPDHRAFVAAGGAGRRIADALDLSDAEASLYAFIGMFMLMGIVKKNGIMIVDFAQQRIEQGFKDDEAIHEASMERFRPIMMTTMAALMGALPIALGFGADGASRRPLGLVVVGGLIVSQFITLFITPAIYLYLEEFQEKVLDRTSFFRSTRDARAAAIPRAVHARLRAS